MPSGDGTGPAGYGPMTGRSRGFCAGFSVPGSLNPIGRGFVGRGCGCGYYSRGRGYRHQFYTTGLPFWAREANPFEFAPGYNAKYSQESEAKVLSRKANFLKQELKAIEDRLNQLKAAEEENPTDK